MPLKSKKVTFFVTFLFFGMVFDDFFINLHVFFTNIINHEKTINHNSDVFGIVVFSHRAR